MTHKNRPLALELADWLEEVSNGSVGYKYQAAKELRALHSDVMTLKNYVKYLKDDNDDLRRQLKELQRGNQSDD